MISTEPIPVQRFMKIIAISFLIYGLLVATHEGEFWPFSIYPMFSQAGNPWTRAMVMDVSDVPEDQLWNSHSLQNLPFDPVPVGRYGVDQIDFSNFISKTENWTPERKNALINMFGREGFGADRWMAAKAEGRLVGRDSVVVRIIPFLLLSDDGVHQNPNLGQADYFKSVETNE